MNDFNPTERRDEDFSQADMQPSEISIPEGWPEPCMENLKKRCLDDFVFIKDAGFSELYSFISSTVLRYDEDALDFFCNRSRIAMEIALVEVFHIADYNSIPKNPAAKIGRLKGIFHRHKELFPDTWEELLTTLNQTASAYHHEAPPREQWNGDAQLCYNCLVKICYWLVWFKEIFPQYISIHGKISFNEELNIYSAAKRNLPEISSIANKLLPNYDILLGLSIDEKEVYKKSLQFDLAALYDNYYETAQVACDTYLERIETFCSNNFSYSKEFITAKDRLVHLIHLLPSLASGMHVYGYFSVIHPIMFYSSWSPAEISRTPFAGNRLSADEIYDKLINSNSFVARIILGKLECPLAVIEKIQEHYNNRDQSNFTREFKKVSCDISFVHDFASFIPFLVKRDYGLLLKPQETAEWLFHEGIRFEMPHPLLYNHEPVLSEIPSQELTPDDKLKWLASTTEKLEKSISSFINALVSLRNEPSWERYYPFERDYITNILESPNISSVLTEVSDREGIGKDQANGIAVLSGNDYLSPQEEFNAKRVLYKKDLEQYILERKREYEAFVPEIKRMEEEEPIQIPQDSVLRELDMSEILTGMTKVLLVCSTSLYMLQQRAAIFIFDVAIDNMPFDRVLSSAEIYEVLKKLGPLGAISILGKLKCDFGDIGRLQKLFQENDKKGFVAMLDSVSCDKSFLYYVCDHLSESAPSIHDLYSDDDDVIEIIDKNYDYYLMQHYDSDSADEDEKKYIEFVENYHKLGLFIEKVKALAQDNPNAPNCPELEKELKDLFTTLISSLIDVYEVFLKFGKHEALSFEGRYLDEFVRWLNLRSFIEKYGKKTIDVALGVPDDNALSPSEDYHFVLPEDLFTGRVDTVHVYIPGLKNALKDNEVFESLFNYILRLGGIGSDEDAGALLRVFTGYPVENANDRAKWETDYHILLYLVKYMFTPKKSYVKMSECIDIYYPSDEERQRAEKSPSSYAERISGDDAPSIIETLHRLSDVFPKPNDPLTD